MFILNLDKSLPLIRRKSEAVFETKRESHMSSVRISRPQYYMLQCVQGASPNWLGTLQVRWTFLLQFFVLTSSYHASQQAGLVIIIRNTLHSVGVRSVDLYCGFNVAPFSTRHAHLLRMSFNIFDSASVLHLSSHHFCCGHSDQFQCNLWLPFCRRFFRFEFTSYY